jgi:hypothetical protein
MQGLRLPVAQAGHRVEVYWLPWNGLRFKSGLPRHGGEGAGVVWRCMSYPRMIARTKARLLGISVSRRCTICAFPITDRVSPCVTRQVGLVIHRRYVCFKCINQGWADAYLKVVIKSPIIDMDEDPNTVPEIRFEYVANNEPYAKPI